MRKSRAEKSGKIQIHNIILNFPTLDFLIQKIKEWEIQNSFCRSLPYFSIYPGMYYVVTNYTSRKNSAINNHLKFEIWPLMEMGPPGYIEK